MESLYSTAKEFYNICDQEGKGYVVKSDMTRLHTELDPLTDEQLQDIFEILDLDNNKYLTVDEFIDGFGKCVRSVNSD
ncbi:unnamed protein product [Soboliphyme baturini]|uniref:EF-hand domain-containing protein n=1 Tax=Soboliphyme baturini TaxID=241478 RepID=A0A183INR4_9BILA|nr:unnamed protein product [Soboliphyme baturini]